MNIKFSNILTIIVLGMAGGAIYCLPYLKYVFYDQMLLNMGITDSQCGLLMTVYAIARSEERRVGKECRSRWSPYH